MIANWVNRFRAAGPDALRPHKKGRKKTLDKSVENSKIVPLEESSVDTSAEHVKKKLEDELLKLRIENAFFKELRRLRLEDEAKMRERQESSTVYRRQFKLKEPSLIYWNAKSHIYVLAKAF